ncbi:zinc finger protein 569-like [Anopheles moucheti]|uniref:zinc finger protein 569-like n=1 Tax=Anopheles moucheti TaxID=186751 RepID=UPI0022F131C2|nr:zinc finger protein 569-like [Anopheles moucheti]
MASVSRKLLNICRFCLCQDESKLRPVEDILPLTIQEVERFTGIKIDTKENISYAICFDCTQKLKISADFLQFCLNNNADFEQLLRVVEASAKNATKRTIQPPTPQERDPLELHFVIEDDDDNEDEEIEEEYYANVEYQKAWNDRVENYSANYIDIGEYSDNDEYEPDYKHATFSNNSLNKSEARIQQNTVNIRGKEPQVREIVTHRTSKTYLAQQLCNLCGKLITNLKAHLESHANDRKHVCPHCPLRMTSKSNMDKHIRCVHLKVKVKTCSICDKSFSNNTSYTSHMNAIHDENGIRFTCTVCSSVFKHKSGLKLHMQRAHSNIRNLACNICGKLFKVRQTLRYHMRVHSTDQPYPCSKCPKRFKSRYAMKTHELTHSEITFDCALCVRKYRYKSLLNMHIRKMHNHPEKEELSEEDKSPEHSMTSLGMASVSRKLLNICRFCLCQDESKLRPVEDILPLTIQEVERFTGIKIDTKESISYAICFDCKQKLKNSADFLRFCLNNNADFEQLLRVLKASAKSVPTRTFQPSKHQERDPLDLHFAITDDEEHVYDEEIEEDVVEINDDDDDDEDEEEENDNHANDHHLKTLRQKAWNDRLENYSANYIDIGECSESDEYEPGSEYSAFSNNRINNKTEGLNQINTANTPEEEPQVREIITHRTRKSYHPQQLCNLCGKLVTQLKGHLESHANERRHACPHCPVKMTSKGNLVKHIHGVHLKLISEKCGICGRGFTNKNSYASHMVAGHGIGDRYTCTMCSKIFNHKSSLCDHMRRTHSNVRNLACDICGKSFKVRRALKIHMHVHSPDQPYQCGKCPKRFKSSYARKIHELTHSGIVFECALCGKTYRYKSLLNMHLRKMHPESAEFPGEVESLEHSISNE